MKNDMTRKQYSNLIRNVTSKHEPGNRNKCFICDSKNNLQLHHITPVFNLSVIAYENNLTRNEVENMYCETEYLCKGHHKKLHDIVDYDYTSKEIGLEEFDKYMELLRHVDLSQVDDYLKDDYNDRINTYIQTSVNNFLDNSNFTFEELEEYVTTLAEIEVELEDNREPEI